ncbi:MAG: alpha/beta hydrolase [Candidatus Moranbacteria bacterium]|nr:alpha/beta hydrolase [Candidatus Moranbacteria bacterium]
MKTLGKVLVGLLVVVAVVLVGGWLALRRPAIPYEALEARYATPASQYLTLKDGVRVHYRDQGKRDGPVLVMVHGFSANLETWEPWVKRLGDRYRIISLDLPGHGLTRAPEGYRLKRTGFVDIVDETVTRLGVEKFVLIGNSMGGGVTWNYALAHPGKLEGAVLVNAAGWIEPREDGDGGPFIFKVLRNPVGRAIVKDLDVSAMTRAGLRDAFAPTPDMADDAMVARYVEMARAPGHKDLILGLMSGYDPRDAATKEKLSKITAPTLVLHGTDDRLIPVSAAGRFGDAIPGATVIVYDKVGHVPMEQIADRSAADLDHWLRTKVWPTFDAKASPE